jgi:hypothetical protein
MESKQTKEGHLAGGSELDRSHSPCWNVVAHALRTLAFEFSSLLARPCSEQQMADFINRAANSLFFQNPNPVLLAAVLK